MNKLVASFVIGSSLLFPSMAFASENQFEKEVEEFHRSTKVYTHDFTHLKITFPETNEIYVVRVGDDVNSRMDYEFIKATPVAADERKEGCVKQNAEIGKYVSKKFVKTAKNADGTYHVSLNIAQMMYENGVEKVINQKNYENKNIVFTNPKFEVKEMGLVIEPVLE